MLTDLLTVAVLAWVGSRLVTVSWEAVRGRGRSHVVEVLRGLRVRHFLPVPVVLAFVLTAAVLVIQVPGLSFGWWTAIGGQGNPVVGSSNRTSGTVLEWLLPALFLLLLVPALPLLVEREERIFRLGSERRTFGQRVARGVVFGLAHALIGIPIGVALALSVGGWWFTIAYLRGYRQGGPGAGLRESIHCHLAYNLVIVGLVLVSLAAGAL